MTAVLGVAALATAVSDVTVSAAAVSEAAAFRRLGRGGCSEAGRVTRGGRGALGACNHVRLGVDAGAGSKVEVGAEGEVAWGRRSRSCCDSHLVGASELVEVGDPSGLRLKEGSVVAVISGRGSKAESAMGTKGLSSNSIKSSSSNAIKSSVLRRSRHAVQASCA